MPLIPTFTVTSNGTDRLKVGFRFSSLQYESRARRVITLSLFCLALGSMVTLSHAAPPIPAKPLPVFTAPPLDAKPSRYAGDRVEAFVSEMSQKLAMRNRTTGPFGEQQDPDAKPAAALTETVSGRVAEPAVSLNQLVEMLVITTIMPGERRFLIGSRTVTQGDELPVTFQGKKQKIRVTEVTANHITFQNTTTGETAIRQLNKLPPGMTPGNEGSSVPGMQPASDEAPINLDPSSP